jgi:hypothetical protein
MKLSMHLKSVFAAMVIALASAAHAYAPGNVRVALVIGNSAYLTHPCSTRPMMPRP